MSEELTEAELRFEKALVVKDLLRQKHYITGTQPDEYTEYEAQINEEIRQFLLNRLDELLGVKATAGKKVPTKPGLPAPKTNKPQTPVAEEQDLDDGNDEDYLPDDLKDEPRDHPAVIKEAPGPKFQGYNVGYTPLGRQTPDGRDLFARNGVIYAWTPRETDMQEDGQVGFFMKQWGQGQVRPQGNIQPVPMISGHQITGASYAHAIGAQSIRGGGEINGKDGHGIDVGGNGIVGRIPGISNAIEEG